MTMGLLVIQTHTKQAARGATRRRCTRHVRQAGWARRFTVKEDTLQGCVRRWRQRSVGRDELIVRFSGKFWMVSERAGQELTCLGMCSACFFPLRCREITLFFRNFPLCLPRFLHLLRLLRTLPVCLLEFSHPWARPCVRNF